MYLILIHQLPALSIIRRLLARDYERKESLSPSGSNSSLRSKRFREANSEERGFRCFARAKNGAITMVIPFKLFLDL